MHSWSKSLQWWTGRMGEFWAFHAPGSGSRPKNFLIVLEDLVDLVSVLELLHDFIKLLKQVYSKTSSSFSQQLSQIFNFIVWNLRYVKWLISSLVRQQIFSRWKIRWFLRLGRITLCLAAALDRKIMPAWSLGFSLWCLDDFLVGRTMLVGMYTPEN